jgi:multisubunit Na+/H+ antiporter MnhE subunit
MIIWMALAWIPTAGEIAVGIFASALMAVLFGDIVFVDWAAPFKPERFFCFVSYCARLSYGAFLSNIILAVRVLSPTPAGEPAAVRVKTTLKNAGETTLFSLALMFSPGMMFMDFEDGTAYIHLMDAGPKGRRAAAKHCQDLEKIVKGVFK